jgi:pimeloyl-ACP methyl ester carboxylesterase
MFFFQTPFADMVVPANDLDFIRRLWLDWSPGYDPTEDVAHVRESLGDGANLQAALAYYRTAFGSVPLPDGLSAEAAALGQPAEQPLLYLHGANDGCIGAEIGAAVEGAVIVADAGHFLHLERPDVVNRLVVDFLTG